MSVWDFVKRGVAGVNNERYTFDVNTGKVMSVMQTDDSQSADKVKSWIYAVHTGTWGGLPTRILWMLSALLGASLPITGYYIWIKHMVSKKQRRKIS